MVASVEERFQAAVNVIKGLPKNGPYQPSTSTMLNFYGLYKQGTEGQCYQKKPGFWDVVGRAKWDAWNSNRHLSREQAMLKYVENLREIIETMSFTSNVQNFVGSISGLDNINLDELDMVAPGMRELAESHPNSPFNSRTNSPQHGNSSNAQSSDEQTIASPTHLTNGFIESDSDNDRTSLKTIGMMTTTVPSSIENYRNSASSSNANNNNNIIDQSDDEYGDPVDMNRELTEAILQNTNVVKQIQVIVSKMNADLIILSNRTSSMEKTVHELHTQVQKTKSGIKRSNYPKWWPFNDISPLWFTLLILWPFIVKRLSGILLPGSSSRRK